MSDTIITAYITKYALTEGILELRGEVSNSGCFYADGYWSSIPRRDWHLTREDAIKRAEEMRLKKIESHKKAIAKLESMKFEI